MDRKLFIAGSTGATGRVLTRLAKEQGVDILAHRRPKHGPSNDKDVLTCELWERPKLVEALKTRTTVISLIGTMRKRFATGDTYESSDIATTRLLVEAAQKAGTIDHFVLLSSAGAGRPFGSYLKAKAQAEAIVRRSSLPYTLIRPGAFAGEGHHPPPGFDFIAKMLGKSAWRTIRVEQLAGLILNVAQARAPLNAVLEGDSLWQLAA